MPVYYTREVAGDAHRRLDKTMAALWPQHSRAVLQTLIKDGRVAVDGAVCRRPDFAVCAGQTIGADFSALPAPAAACAPEALPLDIVYEDAAVIVINKPAGLVVHPGHGNRDGTLQAGLLHHHAPAAALPRAGIVHRLDKDTSGLLVAAKTAAAQKNLIAQFKARGVRRVYKALTRGNPPATGVVDLPIGRNRRQPTRMAVRAGGKPALTRFAVEKRWRNFAYLRCYLETGRTHQIRVHLAHNGYAVVGDPLYKRGGDGDGGAPLINRQALHAERLSLRHPDDGCDCEWHRPPPADMRAALEKLDAGA